MKAVVLDEHGGTEVLQIREIPTPVPKDNEVLVKVHATALNRADILQRKGHYPGPSAEHEIPGLEFAGTVAKNGTKASRYKEGDVIMGLVASGAYAEYLTVHERQVLPVPEEISVVEAAGIPEAWLTAYDALVDKGKLQKNQKCLIHAGASGVGTAAIQIAKTIGSQIAVTASRTKIETCEKLGADLAIDYHAEDFVEKVLAWTNQEGVQVVIDLVGGDYLARNLKAVALKGTIVQVGLMGTGKPELDLGTLLGKRITLIGTVLRSRTTEEKIYLTEEFGAQFLHEFRNKNCTSTIDSVFPLEDIAEAHTRMEQNKNIGKIIIKIL